MLQNDQELVLETIDNPYYGGDDSENASGSESQPGASNVVNVKVTQNPYYAM